MHAPIVLEPGEGHLLTAAGTRTTFKVTSASTDGRFSLAEYTIPPKFPGPPPHIHRKFGHAWYVLEGVVQIQVGGQTYPATAGAFVYVPSGIAHTFSNPGRAPARMLAIDTPGGLEPYFEELARAFPEGTLLKREVVAEIQTRYDTFPAT